MHVTEIRLWVCEFWGHTVTFLVLCPTYGWHYFRWMLHHHTVKCARPECRFLRNTPYMHVCLYWGKRKGVRSTGRNFCTLAPNICGPSAWNFPCVTLVASRILRWLLDFGKNCTPLCKRSRFYLHMEHPRWCNIHVDVSNHTEHSLWSLVVWLLVSTSSIGHLEISYTRAELSLVEFCGKTLCYGAMHWKWSAVKLISWRILRVVPNYKVGRGKLLRQQARWCRELYSDFRAQYTWYVGSRWYTPHFGICLTVAPRLVSRCIRNVCQVSLTRRRQLTSRRRLLQIVDQPYAS
jgi:hypothetical protein